MTFCLIGLIESTVLEYKKREGTNMVSSHNQEYIMNSLIFDIFTTLIKDKRKT